MFPGHGRYTDPMAAAVPDFTVCVVLDARTADQFQGVWPTWRRMKPYILARPFLGVCDWRAGDECFWEHRLRFCDHPDRRIVCWDWPDLDDTEFADMTQRERMLTAWVKVPAMVVDTPYWVKIDTDVVATNDRPWVLPEWFADNPALIGSPWGYTKPAEAPGILDAWAKTIPALAPLRSLDLPPPEPGARRIHHPRICSWICFVDTLFSRAAADYCPSRLPVPSQDTYHWYCAWRQNETIERVRFSRLGWQTVHSDRARRHLIKEVLEPTVTQHGCCN